MHNCNVILNLVNKMRSGIFCQTDISFLFVTFLIKKSTPQVLIPANLFASTFINKRLNFISNTYFHKITKKNIIKKNNKIS